MAARKWLSIYFMRPFSQFSTTIRYKGIKQQHNWTNPNRFGGSWALNLFGKLTKIKKKPQRISLIIASTCDLRGALNFEKLFQFNKSWRRFLFVLVESVRGKVLRLSKPFILLDISHANLEVIIIQFITFYRFRASQSLFILATGVERDSRKK